MLTLNRWKVADAAATIKETMESNQARGVQVVASTVLNPPAGRGGAAADPRAAGGHRARRDDLQRGVLRVPRARRLGHAETRARDDDGAAARGLPRVNGHRDYVVKAVFHGLTGPIDGKTYTDVMMPMGVNNDEWVAAVASYVRRSFGNTGGFVMPADVARVRAAPRIVRRCGRFLN